MVKYRIIVAGGRDFNDTELFDSELKKICSEIDGEINIVSGHASGADKMGEAFAQANGYEVTVFPADWKRYRRGAGPVRNQQMLDYAKEETPMLVAFWDGESRGTKDMIDKASKAGITVKVVRYQKNKEN